LKQFPGYLEKARPGNKKISEQNTNDLTSSQTPQEVLEEAYQTLRQELSAELLSQIKAGSPSSFEQTKGVEKYCQLIEKRPPPQMK
ncbi:MAG: hypothetical protein R6V50_06410, partial [Thermoplasmatota archaeon]